MKKITNALRNFDNKYVNGLNTCGIVSIVIALVALIAIYPFADAYPYQADIVIAICFSIVGIAFACAIFFEAYSLYFTRESIKNAYPSELKHYVVKYGYKNDYSSWETKDDVKHFFTDEIARLKNCLAKTYVEKDKEKIENRIYDAKLLKKRVGYFVK